MSKLSTLALVLRAALPALAVSLCDSEARADGCYICTSGSKDACKDYCHYVGQDTFAARKQCEKNGCKVGGTGSCPTAVNYKVCLGPAATPGRYGALFAATAWCATTPPG